MFGRLPARFGFAVYWIPRMIRHPRLSLEIYGRWRLDKQSLPLDSSRALEYFGIFYNFQRARGFFPNLRLPKEYGEIIQYLKIFDSRNGKSDWIDKVEARKLAQRALGENILVPLVAIADSVEDLSWETLPNNVIIKMSHDSGGTAIIRDRQDVDFNVLRNRFSKLARRRYGMASVEWGYWSIDPRVLVERLVGDPSLEVIDYKFHCVNGTVKWVQIIWNRGLDRPFEANLDRNGQDLSMIFDTNFEKVPYSSIPHYWALMISAAETLASEFEYVRVDLIGSKSRFFFGEMTFWPYSGYYSGPNLEFFGRLLELQIPLSREDPR